MVRLAQSFQWAFFVTAVLVDMIGTAAMQDNSVVMRLLRQALKPTVWVADTAALIGRQLLQLLVQPDQESYMSKARAMSSHCSGCGSIELALRFIVAAWSGRGFPFELRTVSCCAQPLVERVFESCL